MRSQVVASDLMAGSSRGRSKKSRLMVNHQRCWLWGRHVVLETLRAGRWPIVELRLADSLADEDRRHITQMSTERGIPFIIEPPERLTQLCGASDHQGLLAKMPPFPYTSLDTVLSPGDRLRSNANGPVRTALVLLDRIQDPHNFGAIIRAADVLGMDGMIVGTDHQSAVTSAVARSSAGAVNHLPIAQVADLTQVVRKFRHSGFVAVAADADAETSLVEHNFTGPTVLVLGNENSGVSDSLLAACNATIRIPQAGHIGSLNVAVAAGILFYELQRQRTQVSSDL